MSSSKFTVTKSSRSFVIPNEPTPSHALPLSSIDGKLRLGSFVEIFLVYRYGQEPAKVIREALGKALVPYYPLAGRLVRSEEGEGEVHVACTGDGVWFVEASADCSLEDVHWLEDSLVMIPLQEELLPLPPNAVGMPLMMQVTRFTCGGFVVGFLFDHIIADGIGIGQFHNAVGEMARGLEQPSVEPVWLRKDFPSPSLQPRGAWVVLEMEPLEYLTIDIPLDHINQVKSQFMQQMGERCTTFDVSVAKLWQYRTRAIGLESGVDTHLQFFANTRHLLSHVLPREGLGYYGNCAYPMIVTASSDTISHASLVDIVTLIRDAKKRVAVEFSRWVNGEGDDNYKAVTMGYESMSVTDWTHLGLNMVDYGWGAPSYVAPAPKQRQFQLPLPSTCIIQPPAPQQGSRLITLCVKEEHSETLHDQMMSFSP